MSVLKKSKRRGFLPATHARTFPRIQMIPLISEIDANYIISLAANCFQTLRMNLRGPP